MNNSRQKNSSKSGARPWSKDCMPGKLSTASTANSGNKAPICWINDARVTVRHKCTGADAKFQLVSANSYVSGWHMSNVLEASLPTCGNDDEKVQPCCNLGIICSPTPLFRGSLNQFPISITSSLEGSKRENYFWLTDHAAPLILGLG